MACYRSRYLAVAFRALVSSRRVSRGRSSSSWAAIAFITVTPSLAGVRQPVMTNPAMTERVRNLFIFSMRVSFEIWLTIFRSRRINYRFDLRDTGCRKATDRFVVAYTVGADQCVAPDLIYRSPPGPQFTETDDGVKRWDRAYLLILLWSWLAESAVSELATDPPLTEEISNESRSLQILRYSMSVGSLKRTVNLTLPCPNCGKSAAPRFPGSRLDAVSSGGKMTSELRNSISSIWLNRERRANSLRDSRASPPCRRITSIRFMLRPSWP